MTCYSTKNRPTQSFYNKRSFFRFREMFLLMNYPVKKKKKISETEGSWFIFQVATAYKRQGCGNTCAFGMNTVN